MAFKNNMMMGPRMMSFGGKKGMERKEMPAKRKPMMGNKPGLSLGTMIR